MNFEEHAAKPLLADAGIPIPKGEIARSAAEAKKIAEALGKVVIKAQVPTGKRGKAGGIRSADTPEEALEAAQAILGMEIAGYEVASVLVEERLESRAEFYAAVLNDAPSRSPMDAIEAGCKRLVILTEHVPVHDVMELLAAAKANGACVVGPNTAGLVTPGECFAGFMPAFEGDIFRPGSIGVISRSGSLGTLICLNLVQAGFGESAFIGIGGDPIIGTTTLDALRTLDADPGTQAVALVGEIGGAMEEDAAEYAAGMKKPVVAFIAGGASPPGKKMGHAGAIVIGNRGSHASKRKALEAAGARVIESPSDIGPAMREAMG
eukprot:XP_019857966.1 PREDICTED: uncharacterized protein LOC100637479 [Amphimedon queenslandica]